MLLLLYIYYIQPLVYMFITVILDICLYLIPDIFNRIKIQREGRLITAYIIYRSYMTTSLRQKRGTQGFRGIILRLARLNTKNIYIKDIPFYIFFLSSLYILFPLSQTYSRIYSVSLYTPIYPCQAVFDLSRDIIRLIKVVRLKSSVKVLQRRMPIS